jgi:hypothetical protein
MTDKHATSDLSRRRALSCGDVQPTPEEVRAWRASLNRLLSRRTVSWTGEGWMHIHRMAEAERRYKARGLL